MEWNFTIAIGRSRTQRKFKNEVWGWDKLIARLSNPTQTPFSAKEYAALPADRRHEIKDCGGFIGGELIGGDRKRVKNRSLLCFDIDHAESDFWDRWVFTFNVASCLYSTLSHQAEAPRYRLVVPLDGAIEPEKYQPLGRKIAELMGFEQFDKTTFEPQRLMYWPSVNKDVSYVFQVNGGDRLRPDTILNMYQDWRDVSEWPVGDEEAQLVVKPGSKLQDPTEKTGLIGAFCRAYTMTEAIQNFVPDYIASDVPNRYTYKHGTTVNGVVVYDDLWSYSHHETDPACGVECNAFDLVRIHKFGSLDKGDQTGTITSRLPSYKAMCEFAQSDKKVVQLLVEERNKTAELFEAEDDGSWKGELICNKAGAVVPNYVNISLILRHDPGLRDCFGYNLFSRREVAIKDLPWRAVDPEWPNILNSDDAQLRKYINLSYGVMAPSVIRDCLTAEVRRNAYHPVRDYLNSLKWDGIRRIDRLLVEYFGCDDTEYSRAIMRKTMVGAVRRVFKPGCQHDTMLVLKGKQGKRKSTFFRKLGKRWFSDQVKDVTSVNTLDAMQGKWIIEMSELSGLRKAEVEQIKSFLTTRVDIFRRPYTERPEEYPRQCIFVGSTNEVMFLRDPTGNRRFWVIEVPKMGRDCSEKIEELTEAEVDQFWAEAKHMYDQNTEKPYLSERLEAIAEEHRQAFTQESPYREKVLAYLDRLLPENWDSMALFERQDWLRSEQVGTVRRTRVCVAEVWCEALGHSNTERLTRIESNEINSIIDTQPEWERYKKTIKFKLYGAAKGFVRSKSGNQSDKKVTAY